MTPRHHVPLGRRAPTMRRERVAFIPEATGWLAALQECRDTRADQRVGPIAVDGIVLVDSRSVEDASHEVTVRERVAVLCTCWPSRQGKPCHHRVAVAMRLWEDSLDADMSTVLATFPAPALLARLYATFLNEPRARRRFGPGAHQDALPERSLAG